MSETNNPDFNVAVAETDDKTKKVYWHNIGVAWKSEKGINIKLFALPFEKSLMLFPYKIKEQ